MKEEFIFIGKVLLEERVRGIEFLVKKEDCEVKDIGKVYLYVKVKVRRV